MPPEIKIEDIGSHVIFSFRIRTIFRSMRNIQVEQILFAILLELPITDGGQQSTLLFLTNIIGIPHYISCYRATHIQYPIIANHRWTSARLETIGNILDRHIQLKSCILVIEQRDIQIKQTIIIVHICVAILHKFSCLWCGESQILRRKVVPLKICRNKSRIALCMYMCTYAQQQGKAQHLFYKIFLFHFFF